MARVRKDNPMSPQGASSERLASIADGIADYYKAAQTWDYMTQLWRVEAHPTLKLDPLFDSAMGFSVLGMKEKAIAVLLGMTANDFKEKMKDPAFAEQWTLALQTGRAIAEQRLTQKLWVCAERQDELGNPAPLGQAVIELLKRVAPPEESKEKPPMMMVEVNVGDNAPATTTRQVNLEERAASESRLRNKYMQLPDAMIEKEPEEPEI